MFLTRAEIRDLPPPSEKNLGHDLGQDHAQDQDGKILAAEFVASWPKIFPHDLDSFPLDLGTILPQDLTHNPASLTLKIGKVIIFNKKIHLNTYIIHLLFYFIFSFTFVHFWLQDIRMLVALP